MDVKNKTMFKKFPYNAIKNIKYENLAFICVDTNEIIDFQRQICGLMDYDDITIKLIFYCDIYNIIL